MLTGDSPHARRRAVAARVAALAAHNDEALLHVQAFCQAQRLRYPLQVAEIPRVLRRFAGELQDGTRPDTSRRPWWRRRPKGP